jgi:signal transduction histidine kinase/CheY-like chemotaxis protein
MLDNFSNKLAGGNHLRLPVLIALATAFSVLLLIFTFILDVWATSNRQENLSTLAEQIDDQLYRKTEDVGYQLLNSVILFTARDDVRTAMIESRHDDLETMAGAFYQGANHTLSAQINLYDSSGKFMFDHGQSSANQILSEVHDPLVSKLPHAIGTYVSQRGEIHIYASNAIMLGDEPLAYLQVSKPLAELISAIAYLNKVELFLLVNKDLVDQSASEQFSTMTGTQSDWELFDDFVISSLMQGNLNLTKISSTLNSALLNTPQSATYLQDKLDLNNKKMNLGLLPVHDLEGDSIGRLLLLKDISDAYSHYLISLRITSVSFGVIISLIFVYFWFFLGRIERNIAKSEQDIIHAKNQAELARDEAQHAKKQAEEANKIKSDFLAKMSHELRTPLNAIIGITEMMAEDAEEFGDEDYKEPLGRVLRSGKHLLSLINDILDLSKIEAGKMELHPESFDVPLFIGDLNRTCAPLAQKNNNQLNVNISEGTADIYADSTRLKQVLLNLVSNACKFTNDGEILLSVEPCQLQAQDAIRFTIRDSGIGMNEQQLSLLFQDFQQVDSSATRKYEGTGLGLSISKKLVALMAGEISVSSQAGEGSEFIVRLPLNIPDSDTRHESDTSQGVNLSDQEIQEIETDTDSENTTSQNVLIVEDDDNMIELLKYHLGKQGINVDIAKDGAQALQKARANKPALITLDINMPKLNGWDTLAAMRADTDLKDIPIIVLTVQEEKQKGIELGASEYLTKPIDKDELVMIVNKLLKEDK